MAQFYTIKCPKCECNHIMSILDDDFNDNVIDIIYAN